MSTVGLADSLECIGNYLETEKFEELQNEIVKNYIESFLKEINDELIKKGLIENQILRLDDGKWRGTSDYISILSHSQFLLVSFESNLSMREKLKKFDENRTFIYAKTLMVAETIYSNKYKVKEITEEVIMEVREEGLFPEPELFTCSHKCYYSNVDGIRWITFSYNGATVDTEDVHLYTPMIPARRSMLKKRMKDNIEKSWKEKQEKEREANRSYLKRYLWDFLGQHDFKIVEDFPDGIFYDVNAHKISLSFDLNNRALKEEFEKSINEIIEKIYSYEEVKKIDRKLEDIRLTPRYFYLFKENRVIADNVYQIYECKGKNKKALLKIFENNIQLFGRKKRKALQLLGYLKRSR